MGGGQEGVGCRVRGGGVEGERDGGVAVCFVFSLGQRLTFSGRNGVCWESLTARCGWWRRA